MRQPTADHGPRTTDHGQSPPYGYRPAAPAAPAVSIITAYHNTGPRFLATVQSVLRQSLQQWEWLVVNDGSDDPAALRALLPLRSADGRIRVLDRPRQGAAAARNTGAAATAPLLLFLDADDQLAPTALEKLAWSLVSHPDSAFVAVGRVAGGQARQGFDARHALLYGDTTVPTAMVRRTVFDQAGGFDAALPADELWVRCAAHGFWGHDIREALITSEAARPPGQSFHQQMRARYPQLFRDGLPRVGGGAPLVDAHALINAELPFGNRLARPHQQRRILLLLPSIRLGGVDSFALELVRQLTTRGDRVSVCLLRDDAHTWLAELQRATADAFDLAAFLAPADYPRFLHYLIESRQITTVLISNSLLGYQLLPYLRAHCPRATFADYLHMDEPGWRDGGLPRAGIEHEELLDLHIVSSHYLRRWMTARGADPCRVEVCTTNIDPQQWAPAPALRAQVRARLGIAPDLPIILFAGRLVPQKRPLLALEALRRLHAAGTPFVCLVAGDGEDAGQLRGFVRRHRLGRHIRLLGAIPHGALRELLAAADLLFLPSAHEGIALTLYEAMATGVVPVAADVGGQRELVTPECGVLVAHSPDELAEYVDTLRRLLADPGLRAQMAEASRTRVAAHFSADQMVERMQALLDQAVAHAHHEPRPPVGTGAGLAAATLAIEHFQLERRLRGLPPVRIALALRRSSAWRLLGHLHALRALADKGRRAIYAARRALMRKTHHA